MLNLCFCFLLEKSSSLPFCTTELYHRTVGAAWQNAALGTEQKKRAPDFP